MAAASVAEWEAFQKVAHQVDCSRQSVEVEGSASEGKGAIRRHPAVGGAGAALVSTLFNGEVATLHDNFQRAVRLFGPRACWGRRNVDVVVSAEKKPPKRGPAPYTWLSYAEAGELVRDVAAGLDELFDGVRTADDDEQLLTVGIYGRNCVEWVAVENACNYKSLVSVAIYDTFGADAVQYVVDHAEITVVAGEAACLRKLAPLLAGCPRLRHVVQFDAAADDDAFAARLRDDAKVTWHSFQSLVERGRAAAAPLREPRPPQAKQLAILMYTSGTTGMPKGVMITHGNLVAAAAGVVSTLPPLHADDVFISYLPLAHIFERCAHVVMNATGAAIGFYGGDPRRLTEDITALRPTVMAGVPRVYDRLQMGIRAKVNAKGGLSKKVFDSAVNDSARKLARGQKAGGLKAGLAFKAVKRTLGGRLRCAISGGAPLSGDTHRFVQACFGCPLLQGYGLTETCAASTIVIDGDSDVGHVGAPLCCLEIRLEDVPDMNYRSTDPLPAGEVCMRGPCVSAGYYKEADKTKEAWDDDGWFHSGDIGRWNANGTLSIIDRKKNIFKLAQGEYIAAENIELVLKSSPFVSQIFIYGDSFKSCLLAIVATNAPHVADWAKQNKTAVDDLAAFASDHNNAPLTAAVLADLVRVGRAAKLQSFELPRAVIVVPELTVDEDLITPTMKLKRPNIKNRYQKLIDDAYAAIEAAEAAAGSPSAASSR